MSAVSAVRSQWLYGAEAAALLGLEHRALKRLAPELRIRRRKIPGYLRTLYFRPDVERVACESTEGEPVDCPTEQAAATAPAVPSSLSRVRTGRPRKNGTARTTER